jgi:HD-GYP domain-containing protein (c-di-GMP phosphodiesterase class II)
MQNVSAIRVLDAIKALAFIGDLSMGQPTDHSPRTGWLAARLAAEAGLDDAQCGVVNEVSLLRWSGCTANAAGFSDWLGDDIGSRAAMLAMRPDWTGTGESPEQVGATIVPLAQVHCEVSGEVAHMLGLTPATQEALRRIFESWDGDGFPDRKPGRDVPAAVFMVGVAGDLEILSRVYGLEQAQMLIAQKAGRQYPAELARLASTRAAVWLKQLDDSTAQQHADVPCTEAMQLLSAPEIVADVIDLKLPWMAGYSRRVADAAGACCTRLGMSDEATRSTYVAGLLHGMGRMAVPNAIWNTAGELTRAAWEKVRLVPYWTARAGKQIEGLSRESEIASFAYERLDGSGYFRGSAGTAIGREARVLAVAAAWVALRSDRPWRPAFSAAQAAALLNEQVQAGRFDAEVVKAAVSVEFDDLPISSERVRRTKAGLLSPREAEVLRHISLGASNKEAARMLGLSLSTVRTHVESVFRKLECTTRAAATLKASALGYI